MITELLQGRAELYVAGGLTAAECADFELILEFHDELRDLVSDLSEIGAAILLSRPIQGTPPPAALKSRIMGMLDANPQKEASECVVVSGPDGRVQWVNAAFTRMCGFSLEELRGKKLGPILQGEKTDPDPAARLRNSVREHRACRETLVNYHKDGRAYRVDIAISPILDDFGGVLYLAARERELPEEASV